MTKPTSSKVKAGPSTTRASTARGASGPDTAPSTSSAETVGTALGLVETRGLAAGTEAADAMVKAANVMLLKRQQVGGGIITILVRGDVGSVQAAVDAGAAAASAVGQVLAAEVIPRPAGEVEGILDRPPKR
jgi:ethanolamine utilization protein EutM